MSAAHPKKRLLLIDAHALIHRAFHALPPLTAKDGTPVGAIYGFLLIMMRALKDLKPDYVAVAFDSKGKTFRHKQFAAYKATRTAPVDELVAQFPLVREMVDAFGFPTFAVTGYEADDLIGTICHQVESESGLETIIVTGDMDLLQLVNENTKVLRVQRGVKDTLLYDPALVKAKHGFLPEQVTDYKGLRGDSSDNIPGVKGIGEKSATELLQNYGSIEAVYKNLEKIEGRSGKALAGQEDAALLSKELATIAVDAPIEFSLEGAPAHAYDEKKITELFRRYEFTSLLAQLKTLPGFSKAAAADLTPTPPAAVTSDQAATSGTQGQFDMSAKPAKTDPAKPTAASSSTEAASPTTSDGTIQRRPGFDYELVQSKTEVADLAAALAKQPLIALDTETEGLNSLEDALVGISFSWQEGQGAYLDCGPKVPPAIAKILADPKVKKTGHNLKFDIEVLHRAGAEVNGVVFDTMLASYLLNAGSRGHGLDNLAFVEFGHQMQPIQELIGKGKTQITMSQVPAEKVAWYAAEDADFSLRLYHTFAPQIAKVGMQKLLDEIELPTMQVLIEVEEAGVKIDEEFLNEMSKQLHKRLTTLEKQIHRVAGGEFNVASSSQLSEVLFSRLQLSTDKIKKTKTTYSTAASELEKLRGEHEIIDMITEYRELAKLTSTYIDTLPALVSERTGRIHTTFNQTIAATGRLSSTDPNLQNIPIRTELGREIRKAFVPERGYRIVSLDYSQVELRVVAHLAKDKIMRQAFENGEDIHARTAAELNEVELTAVDKEMRRQAKAINFGILYGMGVQGIMRDSGISRDEARAFLDKYFEVHTGIKDYIEEMKEAARKTGYAENIFGRRRHLPEINSGNQMIRAGAERAAINMPVQGAAADIMKLAMIDVQKAIDAGKIAARMILQVHDELVFEIRKDEVETESRKIKKIMEAAYSLGSIPLAVDAEAGLNWGDLKPVFE